MPTGVYIRTEKIRKILRDKAWNKGLTKETDERIKRHSENMKGSKCYMYGDNRTYIEKYGVNKANKMKMAAAIRLKDKTYEEIYGIKKANEIKEKNRENHKGSKCCMYGDHRTHIERYGKEKAVAINKKNGDSKRGENNPAKRYEVRIKIRDTVIRIIKNIQK
jgi:hypothetical protein